MKGARAVAFLSAEQCCRYGHFGREPSPAQLGVCTVLERASGDVPLPPEAIRRSFFPAP